MSDLAELRLPVFLPGNNRDWQKIDGSARITDAGEIIVTISEESTAKLVKMAENNILLQLSFDYRMDDEMLARINAQGREFQGG